MTRQTTERRLVAQGLVGLLLSDQGKSRADVLNGMSSALLEMVDHKINGPADVPESLRPFVSVAPALALVWAECGFPKVELPHRLAASFMATSMPEEIIDELRLPWRCFAVAIPAGLLDINEHIFLVLNSSDGGYRIFGSFPFGIHFGHEPKLSGLASKLIPRDEPTMPGSADLESFPDLAWRHVELAMRMVLGVIAELNEPRPSLRISPAEVRRIVSARDERLLRGRTFKLTRNVAIDVRREISGYASGATSKAVTVRSLVRGHWKQQPHGENRIARKLIHVEPYWRGDEGLPIAIRSHVIVDEQERRSVVVDTPKYVYFVQAGDAAIKIGHSADVERRINSLQTGNPLPIRLLGKVRHVDAERIERRIHRELADLRLEGEWFSCHSRVVAELDRLIAECETF